MALFKSKRIPCIQKFFKRKLVVILTLITLGFSANAKENNYASFSLFSGVFKGANLNNFTDLGSSIANANQPSTSNKVSKFDSSGPLWDRLRKNFGFSGQKDHQNVKKFIHQYSANENRLAKITSSGAPYLYYIMEQIEKRNLPGELALVPIVESAFKPEATSHKGAAGLWQFIPGTGRQYGLKQDQWYDGRRDLTASTKAALDYLSFLYKEFDNNWMLALAAYNAGEGTIRKAIKRNIKAGKSTSFWSLKIPKETQRYVPQILALAEIVKNPKKHDVALPHIANKPYLTAVDPGKSIDFNRVAKMAGMNVKEVKKLNPGYRKQTTHPKGPRQLLLPVNNAKKFQVNLGKQF